LSTTIAVPATPSLRQNARTSALLAAPFAAGSIVLAVVLSLFGREADVALTTLLVVAYAAPLLVELVLRTALPWALQLHYLIFILAGPFLGSALNVYVAIPEWDALVHYDSGIMVGWLGMLMVRRAEERTGALLPRWFGLIVILFTAMAFAAAWEVCEFASDQLIGTVSQANLEDTMGDIVAGTLGGLTAIGVVLFSGRPKTLIPPSLARDAEAVQAAADGRI